MYQNVMNRNAIKELYEWKENNGRKPLVIPLEQDKLARLG